MYGHYTSHRVILHVVGEYHKLSNVDEATELSVRETFKVHPFTLSHHSTMIVWLLHLNEAKRQAIDKQSNVWTEFVLTIFAG